MLSSYQSTIGCAGREWRYAAGGSQSLVPISEGTEISSVSKASEVLVSYSISTQPLSM